MKITRSNMKSSVVTEGAGRILYFNCPICHNKAVVDIDNEVYRNIDMGYHDRCICEECGAELLSEPQYRGDPKFVLIDEADEVYSSVDGDSHYKDGYRYITNHGIGPGTIPKDVHLLHAEDLSNYKTAIWLSRPLTADELKYYDIKPEWIQSSVRKKSSKVIGSSGYTADEIRGEVLREAKNYMTSLSAGFTEDEVDDYLHVDVTPHDDYLRVEVRAELSYDGMVRLTDALNSVVARYDRNAYFDLDEPGIASAYVSKSQVDAAVSDPDVSKTAVECEEYIGFNDWLLQEHGITSDDMTDEDYDNAYSDYQEYLRSCRSITSASYGGAYDIEDDMFFTRDDINEFGYDVADLFSAWAESVFDLSDVYMDSPTKLHIEVLNKEGYETYSADVKIDMRRIRSPRDLYKYEDEVLRQLKDAYLEYNENDEDVSSATNTTGIFIDQDSEIYAYSDPERPIDPPDDRSWGYTDSYTESFPVHVEDTVTVREDGTWEYSTPDYEKLLSGPGINFRNGYLESNEHNILLDSDVSMIEHIDELLETQMPLRSGVLNLSADVTLVYDITVIKDSDDVYDLEDYEFNFYDSSVQSVQLTEAD